MRSWPPVGRAVAVIVLIAAAFATAAIVQSWRIAARPPPRPVHVDDLDHLVRLAIDEAIAGVERDRASPDAWVQLGMIYHANDLLELAGRCYARATSMDDTRAEVWYVSALLSAQRGRLEEATRHMQRSIELDALHAPAYWHIGRWRLDAGAVEEAVDWFERATRIDPGDDGGWIGLAQAHLSANRPAEAVEVIRGRLLAGRNAAYARQLLAAAYRALGRYDEARAESARGRDADPELKDTRLALLQKLRTDYETEVSRATALARAGRVREAIVQLTRLRGHWPEDPFVLNNLATAYLATGQSGRALDVLRAALSADPDQPETHMNLARAYLQQAAGDSTPLEAAARAVGRAIELRPDDSDGYALLGLVEVRMHRPAQAIEAFARAAELDPQNLGLWLDLARLQRNHDRSAEAIVSFARVVEIDPADLRGHVGLANARMDTGDLDAAAAALADAEKISPPGDPSLRGVRERLRRLEGSAGAPARPGAAE